MIQKVLEDFFKTYPQVAATHRFLLAVSGGLDSTVLAELFYRAKLDFSIAHCNFHLRGEDSNRDERFVRTIAEKYQVKIFVQEFDTQKYATAHKTGIEDAARRLRYSWFDQLMCSEGFDWLVTAHHQNDSIETFLFHLLRGTGLSGLHGILPIRGYIIRPFISVLRQEIEDFAQQNKMDFCEDITNIDTTFTRNHIRHRLIPLLQTMKPQFLTVMGNTIERLQGVEKIYQKSIQQIRNEVVTSYPNAIEISIEKLLKTASPETVLFEILSEYGFNSAVVQSVSKSLEGASGKIFYSDEFQMVKDRNVLIISAKNSDDGVVYTIEEGQKSIHLPIELTFETKLLNDDFIIPKTLQTACFDADKLKFPLQLRRWKKGDYFVPFGMKGRKKLSDFFSDNKLSLIDKQNVWLLCSSYDVIWVVGWRIDERYRVGAETKRIFIAQWEKRED